MNCIIIDDEPLAREELHSMLQEISGPAVIGSFSNTLAAEKFLTENEADMVFLDIEMPKMTGLEFVEKIPKTVWSFSQLHILNMHWKAMSLMP